jgi:hypothetical protein
MARHAIIGLRSSAWRLICQLQKPQGRAHLPFRAHPGRGAAEHDMPPDALRAGAPGRHFNDAGERDFTGPSAGFVLASRGARTRRPMPGRLAASGSRDACT